MTLFLSFLAFAAAALLAAGLGVSIGSRPLDERVPPYDDWFTPPGKAGDR